MSLFEEPKEDEAWREQLVTAGDLFDAIRGISTLPGRYAVAERLKVKMQARVAELDATEGEGYIKGELRNRGV